MLNWTSSQLIHKLADQIVEPTLAETAWTLLDLEQFPDVQTFASRLCVEAGLETPAMARETMENLFRRKDESPQAFASRVIEACAAATDPEDLPTIQHTATYQKNLLHYWIRGLGSSFLTKKVLAKNAETIAQGVSIAIDAIAADCFTPGFMDIPLLQ